MIDRQYAMVLLRAGAVHDPALVPLHGVYHIFQGDRLICKGPTIEAALRAGAFYPIRDTSRVIPFAAKELDVYRGVEKVATARSKKTAKRIANALNSYIPGLSGF